MKRFEERRKDLTKATNKLREALKQEETIYHICMIKKHQEKYMII